MQKALYSFLIIMTQKKAVIKISQLLAYKVLNYFTRER